MIYKMVHFMLSNTREDRFSQTLPVTHYSLETPKRVIGKHADPDQMLQNAASDQGLHCLQIV